MKRIRYNKIEINVMEPADVRKLLSKNKGDCLIVPETIDGMSVEGIEDGCFSRILGIKEIVFPESLINVDCGAIANCDVEKLVFGKKLNILDIRELRTNKNLKCIEIDAGCPNYKIIQGNLYNANGTTLYYGFNNTVAKSTIVIGFNAFIGLDFNSIVISENVKHIYDGAFYKCKNLKDVQFAGQKLTSIEENAFSMCKKLSRITIPRSVLRIGAKAFKGSGLRELLFEERETDSPILEIKENAFMSTKLNTVDFSMVKNLEIGFQAFYCAKIEKITLCGTSRISNCVFYQCNIKEITLKSIDVCYLSHPEETETLGINTPELMKLIDKFNNKNIEATYFLHNNVWMEERFW